MSRVVRIALIAVCVSLYMPVLTQHLLSDDMAVSYALSEWARHGELWPRLWSKFATGLDSPSFYYRPLTFLSFGINFALAEVRPFGWHVVNLAGHLAAGLAVFRIASLLQGSDGASPRMSSAAWPSAAMILFLLWGTNVEAVAWVSGRYDVFATAFTLWAVAYHLHSQSALDRHALIALLFGVLALCSKESAAVLPGLIGCVAWIRRGLLPRAARWRSIVADLLPWIVLIATYFALRFAIFGSLFQVYPDAQPLQRIVGGDWVAALTSALPWLAAALPSPNALQVAAVILAVIVLAGIASAARSPALRRVSVGLAVAMAWTLALLLPHLSGLSVRGEGGRLFYMTGAWLALWVALPLSDVGARSYSRAPSRLLSGALILFIVTQAVLLHSALADWIRAGSQMQQLVLALRNLDPSLDGDRYAFVFAPDAIGAAPFARNANGAMVLPPVQPKPLLKRMLVFRPSESAEIPPLVNRRLIPVLKTHALNDAEKHLGAAEPGADPTTLWPTDLMCWRVDTAALVPVTMTEPWRDATHWTMAIRDGLRRAGCE